MNNEKMNQMIDEVYENYKTIHKHSIRTEGNRNKFAIESLEKQLIYTKEEFINKCKINPEFSERWGLKIEERELSDYELIKLVEEKVKNHEPFKNVDFPKRVITITYNETKIESYE